MKGERNVRLTKRVGCRTGSKVQVSPCYDVISKQPNVMVVTLKTGAVFVAPMSKK